LSTGIVSFEDLSHDVQRLSRDRVEPLLLLKVVACLLRSAAWQYRVDEGWLRQGQVLEQLEVLLPALFDTLEAGSDKVAVQALTVMATLAQDPRHFRRLMQLLLDRCVCGCLRFTHVLFSTVFLCKKESLA
jgi:hypothetical protein